MDRMRTEVELIGPLRVQEERRLAAQRRLVEMAAPERVWPNPAAWLTETIETLRALRPVANRLGRVSTRSSLVPECAQEPC